jgi:hypothetical protein
MNNVRNYSPFSSLPLFAVDPASASALRLNAYQNPNQAVAYQAGPFFQYPPPPPEPPADPGSWGDSLRDLSKTGFEKGYEALKKKGIWSGSDSSKNNDTDSIWNVGNEKLPDNLSHLGDYGKANTLAEYEWHAARVGEVDYKDQGDWGSFYAKGATDFFKVQGRVYSDVGFKDWTANAGFGVQGRFELVGHHYEAGYSTPSIYNVGGHDLTLNTKVNGDAYVGANGFAEAEIGIGKNTHLDLGAGGFDGASAALKGSETLGDFGGVNGGVGAWAGVGAKVDVDAGFKNGEFSFHFGAGLALGLGLEYDWGFSINFAGIGDSLYNVGADAVDFIGDAGDWVGDAAGDVVEWGGDAAEAVGDFAEGAVDTATGVVSDIGDALDDLNPF